MSEENRKIFWTKKAVRAVVGLGAGTIVGQIISRNVEPENGVQEVTVFTASTVAGWCAADVLGDYTDRKIDEFVAFVRDVNKTIQETKAEKS